jgi:hypothetical protein
MDGKIQEDLFRIGIYEPKGYAVIRMNQERNNPWLADRKSKTRT